jgi:antirestriction protein
METEQPKKEGEQTDEQDVFRPRILIAADGKIGGWVDANQSAKDLQRDVARMSPNGSWQLVGHQGLGSIELGQDTPLQTISELSSAIQRYGPAFGGLANRLGLEALLKAPERYQTAIVGRWPSFESLLLEMAEDCGLGEALEAAPELLRPYLMVNFAKLAEDVSRELVVVEEQGAVWLFDPWA